MACRSIIDFADGMTLDEYLDDEKTRYAVMRAYEILGEAIRHLPEPMKLANPDIPWTIMTVVRNRNWLLRHAEQQKRSSCRHHTRTIRPASRRREHLIFIDPKL